MIYEFLLVISIGLSVIAILTIVIAILTVVIDTLIISSREEHFLMFFVENNVHSDVCICI